MKNINYESKFAKLNLISQTKLHHKQADCIFYTAYIEASIVSFLPDFCFIDSKLVVREKRASRGDLPSDVLSRGSVTSLALLLV